MGNWRNSVVALSLSALFATAAFGQPPRAMEPRRAPAASNAERRIALVIGNSAYRPKEFELINPTNDAKALGRRLDALGFETSLALNLDLRSLEQHIDRFISSLRADDIALFFFAGHGMQLDDGDNYLVPVNYNAADETDAKFQAYSANRILARMEGKKTRLSLMILDACRNNPYRRVRATGGGLGAMQAGEGSFIAFATAPGKTASDNPRDLNGLFTKHILEALDQPGLDLDQVFSRVRMNVSTESERKQIPFVVTSVVGQFYFLPGGGSAPVSRPAPAPAPAPAPVRLASERPAQVPPQNSLFTQEPAPLPAPQTQPPPLVNSQPAPSLPRSLPTSQASIGVSLTDGNGISVEKVIRGGPAERAGLAAGDRLTAINGQPVQNATHFQAVMAQTQVGQTVRLTVERGGRSYTADVTTGMRDEIFRYDNIVEQAQKLLETDRVGATNLLQQAIAMDPARPEAYSTIGVLQYQTGDFQNAVPTINKGFQLGGPAIFVVMHHHVGDISQPTSYCNGLLAVTNKSVRFHNQTTGENFEFTRNQITEAKVNDFLGSALGMFHIKVPLNNGKTQTYNFVGSLRRTDEANFILGFIRAMR